MIPWIYQNKYYIIDCSFKNISINNIFEDENYAILKKDPEFYHYCGYIYNNIYLCVSDSDNKFIRIWDLVKKVIYKQINYDANYGFGIIPWNSTFSILGCKGCLVVINIEKSKMVKKIELDNINSSLLAIRRIKTNQFGECLICSDGNNIRLFSL